MTTLNKMYEPKTNSPESFLKEKLNQGATVLYVMDNSIFTNLPSLATIGNGANAETVLVNSKRFDNGYNITRAVEGVEGTWDKGEVIARNFTALDHLTLIENINKLNLEKVEKITGKDLSSNDFTDAYKNKLIAIEDGANKTIVDSSFIVNSTNPIQSKIVKNALNNKVDKVSGKDLSSNDYSNEDKAKVSAIPADYNYSQSASYDLATPSVSGLMSARDKEILECSIPYSTMINNTSGYKVFHTDIELFPNINYFVQGSIRLITMNYEISEYKLSIFYRNDQIQAFYLHHAEGREYGLTLKAYKNSNDKLSLAFVTVPQKPCFCQMVIRGNEGGELNPLVFKNRVKSDEVVSSIPDSAVFRIAQSNVNILLATDGINGLMPKEDKMLINQIRSGATKSTATSKFLHFEEYANGLIRVWGSKMFYPNSTNHIEKEWVSIPAGFVPKSDKFVLRVSLSPIDSEYVVESKRDAYLEKSGNTIRFNFYKMYATRPYLYGVDDYYLAK